MIVLIRLLARSPACLLLPLGSSGPQPSLSLRITREAFKHRVSVEWPDPTLDQIRSTAVGMGHGSILTKIPQIVLMSGQDEKTPGLLQALALVGVNICFSFDR